MKSVARIGLAALVCAALAGGASAQGPASAPAVLPLKDSVSQYGITWKFEKAAPVGQFITGDFYVVGPVTIVAIDPAPAPGKNGSELNPATGSSQGYNSVPRGGGQRNETLAYDAALAAKLPVPMKPGDSLVSTIAYEPGERHPNLSRYATTASASKAAAVLSCLEKPVPPDTFRPSYCGRQARLYRYSDLQLDKLLSLKPTASEPNLAAYERLFERPWIDHVWHWGGRETHPGLNMPDYGQSIAMAVSEASLLLLCDYPIEKKRKLLTEFVQYGIDLAGCLERGLKGWPQAGGFGSGRKWPILFAGILLGDEKMQHVKGVFGDDEGTMLDQSWTGANVVFTGHSGRDGMGDPERGEYENLHPSRWPGEESEGYRRCCNSHCWVGYALAARLMHAEKLWDHDAFFAYVDRWMGEDDEEAMNHLERAYKVRGRDIGNMRNPYARQRRSWQDFVTEMWKEYRGGPGMGPSLYKTVETFKTGNVKIDGRGGFVVDGKPFLPIMLVEGEPGQIELAKSLGVNTFLGSGWKNKGFDRPYKEFLDKLAEAGLYGVFGADARLAGNKNLLGYLQYDQPDRAKAIREVDVTLDKPERGNRGRPSVEVADGDVRPGKGAVLGPIEPGMEVTIKVKAPVTASALAVYLEKGSPTLPNEVAFLADGNEILKASIQRQDGQQKFDLKEAATFKTLTMKVLSIHAGTAKWGRIDEIQALGKDGKPIPLYSERREPTVVPAALEDVYKWCKGRDASKPVFVDFASFAAPADQGWDAEGRKALYPQYVKQSDAAGFEFPRPGLPGGLADAVKALRDDAGAGRPLFVCLVPRAGEDPADLRAEAWAAVISGAVGIGYRLPTDKGAVVLADEMKAKIKQVGGKITSLAPAILAEPAKAQVQMSLADNLRSHARATQFDGFLYVFAQNIDPGVNRDKEEGRVLPRGGKAAIKVAGLKAGTKIEVVDEDRTLTAEDGQFTDDFAPLAEHVYRWKP